MAFALGNHTGASLGTNGGTTSAIDTTGASFLVAVVVNENNKTSTVTDSKGNTWFAIPLPTNTQQYAQIWYAFGSGLVVGTGHTLTVTSTGGANAACFAAFTGSTATVDPLNRSTWAFGASGATLANLSLTPNSNNQLVIAGLMFNLTETGLSINGGFTITDTVNFNTGVSYGVSLAYLIQTSAAAAAPTWTRSGTTSAQISTALASFRPDGFATGGGGEFSSASFGI